MEHRGIMSSGNWVVDYVKIIDHLPERNMLASILGQSVGLGGAPHNVLVGLAVLDPSLPLFAGGMIGKDAGGELVIEAVDNHKVNRRFLYQVEGISTSYTYVMTESATGYRTFFHHRGANAFLGPEHFKRIDVPARIFHLGYLLLLDLLDSPDPDFGVVAAGVLKRLSEQGYKVSVDVISEESDRYQTVVLPCLPYIDYLIINETEAGRICGLPVRGTSGEIDHSTLVLAAKLLIDKGVRDTVVIHFPEGGYALSKTGEEAHQASFVMEPGEIKGTVGAGDAFCAGMLYAFHENWLLARGLELANANAAISLTHPASTGAAKSLAEVLDFARSRPVRG
ncbi:MAG: carbohydrate kinase family protein [Porphyromonadaceae bacterium]|nr:MAG: carbohydrate kinase family protein [Porphyromonadaceae bacterium]